MRKWTKHPSLGLAIALGSAILLSAFSSPLSAQSQSRIKHEFGIWVGASNPVGGTAVDEVLDSNIGGGLFYRFSWPWVFYTEFGSSYTNYFSRTTQSATVIPVYAALAYPIQLPIRMQLFLKAGGGTSYVLIRPNNIQGWEPLGFAGAEFSIVAGKRFRIGVRLDYNLIYEKHLADPPQQIYPLTPGSYDPRFQRTVYYKKRNGHFFHFGLMSAFIF